MSAGRILAALGIAALVIGLGVGAYFVGHSRGEDVASARAAGAAAGRAAGAKQGARAGYDRGFHKGRDRGLATAYDAAYRRAYAQAFREAGVAPPVKFDVPQSGGAGSAGGADSVPLGD
jgi:hypothetical protein